MKKLFCIFFALSTLLVGCNDPVLDIIEQLKTNQLQNNSSYFSITVSPTNSAWTSIIIDDARTVLSELKIVLIEYQDLENNYYNDVSKIGIDENFDLSLIPSSAEKKSEKEYKGIIINYPKISSTFAVYASFKVFEGLQVEYILIS